MSLPDAVAVVAAPVQSPLRYYPRLETFLGASRDEFRPRLYDDLALVLQ